MPLSRRENFFSSNVISSSLLFATVATAPLPFGSTQPTAVAIWCIVLGIATVFASPRALCNGQLILLGFAGFMVIVFGLIVHEQLAERPWFATPNPLWNQASNLLETSIESSASIARHKTFFALGAPLGDMLALICSIIVCADQRKAHQLLKIIAWSGFAYAVYGIVTFLFDPTTILGRHKQAYLDVLTATFVNRNTAAVYFGSCSIIWFLLLSDYIRRKALPGKIEWGSVLHSYISKPPAAIVFSFSMFFVCLTAMFMTNSRAGVILSLVSLLVAIGALFHRDLPARGRISVVGLVAGPIILILLQVMGAGVSGRLEQYGLAGEGRLETYRSTLKMIMAHPWFGTGLGTFAASFPAYRSAQASVWGVWDRAHSTVLEIASDLGIPFAALVTVAWIAILAILIRGIRIRQRGLIVPVAALSIAGLAVSHSLIDFSLQIPGYALVVFALVGAGLSQSFRSHGAGNSAKSMDSDVPRRDR